MYINLSLQNIIIFLIIGIVAGFIANALLGRGNSSLVANFLLGLGGAIVGGILLPALGLHVWGLVGTLVSAVVGAVLIILAARLLNNRPYNLR